MNKSKQSQGWEDKEWSGICLHWDGQEPEYLAKYITKKLSQARQELLDSIKSSVGLMTGATGVVGLSELLDYLDSLGTSAKKEAT